MGTKKQVQQAKKQLRQLERIVADATAGAQRRVGALDDQLRRSAEETEQALAVVRGSVEETEQALAVVRGSVEETEQALAVVRGSVEETEQALAVVRGSVEETERHRTVVERAAEAAISTVVDLEGRGRQRAEAIDRQVEAALAHVEASGHAAEQRVTVEADAIVADLARETEQRIRRAEDDADEALRYLDDRVRSIAEQCAARLDDLDRVILRRLEEPAGDAGCSERDAPGFEPTDAAGPDEPALVPISVSLADEAEAATPITEVGEHAPFDGGPSFADAPSAMPSTSEFVGTAATSAPSVGADARPSVGESVSFRVAAAQVHTSLKQLARTAADGWVHAEIVPTVSEGRPLNVLRLTVRDVSGFWEYHDISGQASAVGRASVTVDLGELAQAIELERHNDARDMVSIGLGSDITVGTVLVLAHTAGIPRLAGERRKIERLDLRHAEYSGLIVDSQIGRFEVPSRLVSLLRSRRGHEADLVTVDGRPFLSAHVAGPTPETTATILAPLDPGTDAPDAAPERRADAVDAIGQLVGALSSSSSPEELATIITTGVGYARRRAAAHPALPGELIDEMLRDGTVAMRAAAASNPSIPIESIEGAAADVAPAVRAAVATNPHVPPTVLLRLARDDASQVRTRVATNAALPLELLEQLAEDPDPAVREAVAANERTSAERLVAMTHDASPRVCAAVAQNPNCPIEMLEELLAIVPEVVLGDPRAPERLLVAGSQVRARHLRAVVAANPSTPVRQLQALARDPDPEVRDAVADNVNAPSTARRRARRQGAGPARTLTRVTQPTELTPPADPVTPLT